MHQNFAQGGIYLQLLNTGINAEKIASKVIYLLLRMALIHFSQEIKSNLVNRNKNTLYMRQHDNERIRITLHNMIE